ncbi:hypothetical protein T4D_14548 [Trichinella pseudospiralis]|uniref:Uncharacterized protein n=1 Tax=Trichinella pseudospiralis TaxID=6337 RepID=A0A0V1FZG0_TRIPS|nr:hypothetical protein T4D_14548 [Trichinella pseudospiralis]
MVESCALKGRKIVATYAITACPSKRKAARSRPTEYLELSRHDSCELNRSYAQNSFRLKREIYSATALTTELINRRITFSFCVVMGRPGMTHDCIMATLPNF